MTQYATYLRVSTRKQGASGLGMDAQRKMCKDFIVSSGGTMVQEFSDVESGTHRDRKGLWQAIEYCQKNQCPLVIAKLDRLARDVEFCFKVINTGIDIHFTDMPTINTLLLGVFASVAQYERELTSDRTKKALAAKKAKGEKLGGQCEKWQRAYKCKTKEKRKEENMKRGTAKNLRHLESRDVKAFIKILRKQFPLATSDENLMAWDWSGITTKDGIRQEILGSMREYRDIDPTLFVKWNFDDCDRKLQVKLASYIGSLRASVRNKEKRDEYDTTRV